jgi:hypothetical protein
MPAHTPAGPSKRIRRIYCPKVCLNLTDLQQTEILSSRHPSNLNNVSDSIYIIRHHTRLARVMKEKQKGERKT